MPPAPRIRDHSPYLPGAIAIWQRAWRIGLAVAQLLQRFLVEYYVHPLQGSEEYAKSTVPYDGRSTSLGDIPDVQDMDGEKE